MQFKPNPEAEMIDAIQCPIDIDIIKNDGTKFSVAKGDWISVDGMKNLRVYTDETITTYFTKTSGK